MGLDSFVLTMKSVITNRENTKQKIRQTLTFSYGCTRKFHAYSTRVEKRHEKKHNNRQAAALQIVNVRHGSSVAAESDSDVYKREKEIVR